MPLFTSKPPRGSWLVGHRGAMGHAPENTMASFDLGRRMGADFVECDVHLSRDGRCVVMHDESVERTTNGRGLIKNLNRAAIKRLDAGSWLSKKFKNERVPLLQELLAWVRRQKTLAGLPLGVLIEIKNEPVRYLGIERKVIDAVVKTDMGDRVVLISFDHGAVKRAKFIRPRILTGMLYSRPLEDAVRRARQIKADVLFPRRHLVTRPLIAKAHKAGLRVATWTVNEAKEMKKLLACGVHAMATNFPDKLNRVLNA